MIPPAIRDDLADLVLVAAVLAREGDVTAAMTIKRVRDNLAQHTCDHREGTADYLYMSGTVTKCRACGKQDPNNV